MTEADGLRFTKMHSLGNDFVMIDGVSVPVALRAEAIRQLADRHFGVGCDQVILVEQATGAADFFMRIFNTDGSESGQCGNGARCLGRFVHDRGLTSKQVLEIETISTRFRLEVGTDRMVSADLADPVFAPAEIPFRADAQQPSYKIAVDGSAVEIGAVSMGNPHAVLLVDDVDHAPVHHLGPLIEHHADFPERTNVEFVEVVGRDALKIRVWERGVGETLACGSGACAAVAVARVWDRIDDAVLVTLPGGTLSITWSGHGPMGMRGPTETVFDGVWVSN